MKYSEFCSNLSNDRLNRYLTACNGNKAKAMLLYRHNIRLSAAMLSVIAMFEVCLRNHINDKLFSIYGADWLRDSALPGGIFASDPRCHDTTSIIINSYHRLINRGIYSHGKLLAELDFGNWRYMFSPSQYRATGRTLLSIFPAKPTSTPTQQYNSNYVYNRLAHINKVRNRIAHHEPICFDGVQKSTYQVRQAYKHMTELLAWMNIDYRDFFRGIDSVIKYCELIDNI